MNRILVLYLRHLIKTGDLTVIDSAGRPSRWGDGTGKPVRIRFHSRRAERAVAFNPGLKVGEVFMDGGFEVEEGTVYDLIALAFANAGSFPTNEPWMRAAERLTHLARAGRGNTPKRSRRNVQHHYDLSGALYDLFLDSDRQYSCAYFSGPEMDIEEAQRAKKRHIAAKLLFDSPGLSALDIGCGWGGLGLYLATTCGAQVMGVTLSDEQHAIARRRAAEAGLSAKADFRLLDYRNVEGPFDRIVSVGMFEHVGREHFAEFFGKAASLLSKDGVMLLHTIGRYDRPAPTNSFITRHIFPGGYIPSLSEISVAAENSGLMMTDIEVLRLHYAETLQAWRERFLANREAAKALYDERFCRMWEFYLASAEASFRYQDLVVFQVQLAHRHGVVPITRDYIAAAEAGLASRERAYGEAGRCAAE